MRFVRDDREPFAFGSCELPHGVERERKRLDRAGDDLLVARQRLCKLAALARVTARDRCYHARLTLKVEQSLLELRVNHIAVGNHEDAVEYLLMFGVMQLR